MTPKIPLCYLFLYPIGFIPSPLIYTISMDRPALAEAPTARPAQPPRLPAPRQLQSCTTQPDSWWEWRRELPSQGGRWRWCGGALAPMQLSC